MIELACDVATQLRDPYMYTFSCVGSEDLGKVHLRCDYYNGATEDDAASYLIDLACALSKKGWRIGKPCVSETFKYVVVEITK